MVAPEHFYGEKTDDPANTWPYARGHPNRKVAAVIALLEDWYWAIEHGIVQLRLPDLHYVRPDGKPEWSAADVDRIIAAIDEEYVKELGHNGSGWAANHGCQDGPGFHRLAPAQRLALAQQLEQVLESYRPHYNDVHAPQPAREVFLD